ncbi:MAG TPA: family 20 glycosylhydrolase [Terriglobia bacterium]|nr:family 20 glycosylhydrolase [Terriglobia bacterium]
MTRIPRREFLRSTTVGLAAVGLHARRRALTRQTGAPAGRLQLRGLTVDAARLAEKPAYYRRLIDFCREWDLNALLFRLTDDQGSMLRFRSHPELVTHAHALTPEEARELARYGEKQGVTLIPEVESFGHSRYITAVPRYAHLGDGPPGDREHFVGLVPVNPETLALMRDLYREVAAVFPSAYLHGGCDEVNWGGSEASRRALQTRSRAEIWADYLNSLDSICREMGKELIVWGDYVVHKEPDILPRLSKRVIVMDWQYYATDPKPLAMVGQEVIDHGLRAIGAPAIISCEWGPRAGELQLRNIDAYADGYARLHDARALGVVVTNWVPSRYLQQSLWDTFAYAAIALNQGSAAARTRALRSFVERFYGARWSPAWEEAFRTYYRITPNRHSCAPQWQGPRLPVPWAGEADFHRMLTSPPPEVPPFKELHSHLAALGKHVRRKQDDFDAFVLSAEYLEYAYWRETVVRDVKMAPNARSAGALFRNIADRDRGMVQKLDAAWNVGRFADSPAKMGPVIGLRPPDQLLFNMHQAAQFSAQLAAQGDRFLRLLG